MSEIGDILWSLERARLDLYRASDQYNLGSPLVLKKSQELDKLLNQYNQLIRRCKNGQ